MYKDMKQNKEKRSTAKDMAVIGWFALSFAIMVSMIGGPVWVFLLALANFAASAYFANGTSFADDEEEETSAPSQTNQEGQQ